MKYYAYNRKPKSNHPVAETVVLFGSVILLLILLGLGVGA